MACGTLPIGAVNFNSTATTADSTTGLTVKLGTATKVLYLTDITISTDTAQNIEVQSTTGTPMVEHQYFPAVSIWSKTWSTPIPFPVGEGLKVVGSLAGNVSVTITGYLK